MLWCQIDIFLVAPTAVAVQARAVHSSGLDVDAFVVPLLVNGEPAGNANMVRSLHLVFLNNS